MTQDKWQEHVAAFLDRMRDVLSAKGKDYGDGQDDRLRNFKEIGAEQNIDPRKVCMVLMAKHTSSVRRHVDGKECVTEAVQDRIVDWANYLVLLSALEMDHVASHRTKEG